MEKKDSGQLPPRKLPPGEFPPRKSSTLNFSSQKLGREECDGSSLKGDFTEGEFRVGDFLGGSSPGGKCPAVVASVGIFWEEIFLEPERKVKQQECNVDSMLIYTKHLANWSNDSAYILNML